MSNVRGTEIHIQKCFCILKDFRVVISGNRSIPRTYCSEQQLRGRLMKTYYIVSGGFDPIHEGHIEMIKAGAAASDGVILLLNSDAWLCRKKGKNFMNYNTRRVICENLKGVIDVLAFNDDDNSASDGIRRAREKYADCNLVFANGGDRTKDNIPESAICKELNVSLAFGVGGENKANSSSWILDNWKKQAI